jgi:hypothetical protein
MTAEDLKHAIDLVRQGHKSEGAQALMRYLDEEPQNATAWLWLAAAVPDAEKGRFCLEQVLAIDPQNKKARDWLARLGAQETTTPAPAPPAEATPEVEAAAEEVEATAEEVDLEEAVDVEEAADLEEAVTFDEVTVVETEEGAPDSAVEVTAATEDSGEEETALSFAEERFGPSEAGEEGEEEPLAFDDDLFADFEAEEEPPAAEIASFEEELFAIEEGLFELEPEEAPVEPISDEELFKMDDDLAGEETFVDDDAFPAEEAFAAAAESEPVAPAEPEEEAFPGDEFLADEFAGEDELAGATTDDDAFAADFLPDDAFAAEDTDVAPAAADEDDDFTLFEELAAASAPLGEPDADEAEAEDDLLSFEQDVFGPATGDEEVAPAAEDTFSFDALSDEAQDEDLEPDEEAFLFADELEATADDGGATVVAEPRPEQGATLTLDEDLAAMFPDAEQPAAVTAVPADEAMAGPTPREQVPVSRPPRRTGQVVVAIIALILLVGICGLIVLFALQFTGV